MKKELLYWNQSLQDNVLETLMLLLALAFLAYVIRLACFDADGPDERNEPDQPGTRPEAPIHFHGSPDHASQP